MKELLAVGAGGFLGAAARYLLGGHTWWWQAGKFPLGTFVINVCGCLVIGILAGLAEKRGWPSGQARLFLMTGILGGFTTFSAFGLESVTLLRRGELGICAAYVCASVVAGLAVVWLGMKITA